MVTINCKATKRTTKDGKREFFVFWVGKDYVKSDNLPLTLDKKYYDVKISKEVRATKDWKKTVQTLKDGDSLTIVTEHGCFKVETDSYPRIFVKSVIAVSIAPKKEAEEAKKEELPF